MFQIKKKKKGRLTEALKFQGKEKKFLEKKNYLKKCPERDSLYKSYSLPVLGNIHIDL